MTKRKYTRSVSTKCMHYRERMSECRNCDPSDAPYKICYLQKKAFSGPNMGIIDVEKNGRRQRKLT